MIKLGILGLGLLVSGCGGMHVCRLNNPCDLLPATPAQRDSLRQEQIESYGWGPVFTMFVVDRSISIGMTPEMVRVAWGEPSRINKTISRMGRSEQWVYGGYYLDYTPSYVYFRNGIVSTIQTNND